MGVQCGVKQSVHSKSNFLNWDADTIKRENFMTTGKEMKIAASSCDKAKTVCVPLFWPFEFFGPVQKSKQKNADWKCMKCLELPTQTGDKIVFYKSRRTDATVEICSQCITKYEQKKRVKGTKNHGRSVQTVRAFKPNFAPPYVPDIPPHYPKITY